VATARTVDAGVVLPLLRTDRPTVMYMIPADLLRLVREHGATRVDFASLRLFRCGADKVPPELEAEFQRLTGLVIDEGYGMTETGFATINPPSGLIKSGSVGRPSPGYEMILRDDAGGDAAVDAPGRLFMKTPTLTPGYWNDPTATSEAIKDGWLDTGDIMKADSDGYLWFCGRKKQIIVHDGSNIFPQEVEDATRAPGGGKCRCHRHPRPAAWRECARLRRLTRRRRAPEGAGADRFRPRAGRLQGTGGDRVPRRDPAQCDRQGRPVRA
jgi:acyl-CoA synthetase (AMP-forming)/AMP-acid ligase II